MVTQGSGVIALPHLKWKPAVERKNDNINSSRRSIEVPASLVTHNTTHIARSSRGRGWALARNSEANSWVANRPNSPQIARWNDSRLPTPKQNQLCRWGTDKTNLLKSRSQQRTCTIFDGYF